MLSMKYLNIHNLQSNSDCLSKHFKMPARIIKSDEVLEYKPFSGADALANYNRIKVNKSPALMSALTFQKNIIDIEKLKNVNIPNFAVIEENGIRGESLSSKNNRKFLIPVSKSGITTIVDLRDKYTSTKYPELCEKYGLKYYNIPIDSSSIDDKVIIENLPKLFEITNQENYYIACAMGLHRTDIALALNYLFNPIEHKIPVMHGHQRNGIFKQDDIIRRINSIKNNLTDEHLEKFGWKNNFSEIFEDRKTRFISLNKQLAE